MVSLYCFNKLKVGNLKFANSNLGSNSPNSCTNLSDKFSATLFSSLPIATSISTMGSNSSAAIASGFKLGSKFSSIVREIPSFFAFTSECLEIVGFKSITDFSNSDLLLGSEFKGIVGVIFHESVLVARSSE